MKSFLMLAAFCAAILLVIEGVLYFFMYAEIMARYRELVLVIAAVAAVLLLLEAYVVYSVWSLMMGGRAIRHSTISLRMALSVLLPFFIYLTGLFRGEKDSLRRLYIDLNNCVSSIKLKKARDGKLLVLIPHCMQNKDCMCRITEDIQNCLRCGKCKISEIAGVAEQYGIKAAVAKGGTAARNIVKEAKPDCILAVACERDLVSGIADVGRIPVIGVINQRPNGYCNNTTVDMSEFRYMLQTLLKYYIETQPANSVVKTAETNSTQ